MTDFQPRYIAYARSHGREPEAQLAHDRERWPGGANTGFIVWVSRRWREWANQTDTDLGHRTDAHHIEFDAWLGDRTDRLYTHAERLANDPAFLAEVIALERRLAAGDDLGPGLTADEFAERYLTGGAS